MTESKKAEATPWSMIKDRIFGRGTMFLLISLLVIGGWSLLHPEKVTIERQVATGGETHFKRTPSVSNLLAWSKELDLLETQEASLKTLLQKEHLQLKPIDEEIGQALQEFKQFVQQREGKSAATEEIQAAAQPISKLSRMKRQVEQSFAERGQDILDATQKTKLSRLWQTKLARLRSARKEVANP